MGAIDTLREGLDYAVNVYGSRSVKIRAAREALDEVDALIQAAEFAIPCIDRNATLPRKTLEDAVRRVKGDT